MFANCFKEKIEIADSLFPTSDSKLCKGVHSVDLGESFQTHIYLQNLASMQPRTSPVKFALQALQPAAVVTLGMLSKT